MLDKFQNQLHVKQQLSKMSPAQDLALQQILGQETDEEEEEEQEVLNMLGKLGE